ncbi:hypothetical protein B0H16DRAFT_1452905 [Mycena metata]|uniref:Uncharacterized protein n=1 Tax=Mycena metata TaxID=1033252 RepID=A0AAD7JP46_9AGAR|nr:hypothetical protein B0H16DRAFT_1452905 [Mycena metata]
MYLPLSLSLSSTATQLNIELKPPPSQHRVQLAKPNVDSASFQSRLNLSVEAHSQSKYLPFDFPVCARWVTLHGIIEFVLKLESNSPQTSPRRSSNPRASLQALEIPKAQVQDMRRVWVSADTQTERKEGGEDYEKEGAARGSTPAPIRRGCRVRVAWIVRTGTSPRVCANSARAAHTDAPQGPPRAHWVVDKRRVPSAGNTRLDSAVHTMNNGRMGGDETGGPRAMARRETKEGEGGDDGWDVKKKAEVHTHHSPSSYPSHQPALTFPAPAHVTYTLPRRRGVMGLSEKEARALQIHCRCRRGRRRWGKKGVEGDGAGAGAKKEEGNGRLWWLCPLGAPELD